MVTFNFCQSNRDLTTACLRTKTTIVNSANIYMYIHVSRLEQCTAAIRECGPACECPSYKSFEIGLFLYVKNLAFEGWGRGKKISNCGGPEIDSSCSRQ